jgi:hypothetical protein
MIKKILDNCLDYLIICIVMLCLIVFFILLFGVILFLGLPICIIIAIVYYISVGIKQLYNCIKNFFKKIKYPIDK